MDGTLITNLAMELLESLDDDPRIEDHKIIECGIVVVLDSEDETTVRTRTTANQFHIKRGIWELALETVKSGNPSIE